eukprot:scaffold19059_cov39-Cyclotella_meneghiniana.AAC.1
MKFSACALIILAALANLTQGHQDSLCPLAPIATKVKVQSTTGAPLTIRELRIFSDSNNVAIGKNATQSSDLDGTHDASRAVDGRWGTYSSTGEQGCLKWLEVDLNEPLRVEKVLAVNRKECSDDPNCGCQLSFASASLLDIDGNWVPFHFVKKCTITPSPTRAPVTLNSTISTAAPITSSPTQAPVTLNPTVAPVPSISPTIRSWIQLGQDIDGEAKNDYSGHSVSISGDGTILAIGAYGNDETANMAGHVRVFNLVGTTWVQVGHDINGEAWNDASGHSVSLSGDGTLVAIGATGNSGYTGHVRAFKLINNIWVQGSSDTSGYSVSLSFDGTVLAIGARQNDGNGIDSGHVRVFKLVDTSWIQVGQDIDGERSYDYSGQSVSLSSDGTVVAIGAPRNDGDGCGNYCVDSGHVRVFNLVGTNWVQLGQDIDGKVGSEFSGSSVSLSGDGTTVAIGKDLSSYSGHVRVFKLVGTSWSQIGQDILGEAKGDYFGYSVSLSSDGSVLAVGAPYNDGSGSNTGHVRVFKLVDSNWVQMGQDIDGEPNPRCDWAGSSVSLSSDGSVLAIGAPRNDGSAVDSGHVRVFLIRDRGTVGMFIKKTDIS